MNAKLQHWFVVSADLLLLVTGLAKVFSAFGEARVLTTTDPLFEIPFRYLIFSVGLTEITIAVVCSCARSNAFKMGLLLSLSLSFLAYRFGLYLVGYSGPCHCLGNLTDALHILPQTADMTMKIILAYLLLGSCAGLLDLWRQRKGSRPSPPILPQNPQSL